MKRMYLFWSFYILFETADLQSYCGYFLAIWQLGVFFLLYYFLLWSWKYYILHLYIPKKNEFSFVSFFSVSLRVYFCRICFDYYQKLKFIRLLISLELVSDPLLVSLSYLLPSSILNKTIGSRCYLFLVHLVNPIWESKL